MKTFLSLVVVAVAGVLGLAVLLTDVGPGATEGSRFLVTGLFFLLVGLALGRWHARGSPAAWAAATAWAPLFLGLVGVWISLTAPASGDWSFALALLLVPLGAALVGSWFGVAVARRG